MPKDPAANRRLRVVCLSPFVPHPSINHAGGRLLHDYLCRLLEAAEVALVAPETRENRWAVAYAPERLTIHLFPGGPLWRLRAGALLRQPRDGFFGFTDGIVALNGFRSDPRVAALVRGADLVEVQFSQFLPLLDVVRTLASDVPLTAWEHDVFSEHVGDVLRETRSLRLRLQSYGRRRRIPVEERRLLNLCSAVIALSPKDAEQLIGLGVRAPIQVVYPRVEVPPQSAALDGPSRVMFAGALWRPENQRAAAWLTRAVWPAVRSGAPDAQLVLAGDAPTAWLEQMRTLPGVEATGFVRSFDPLYHASSVAVVPVRSSAGIKIKMLQAMAFGLPVVSTVGGASAITVGSRAEPFAAVTDDPSQFASAIVRCLSDREHGRRVGALARQWVTTHCSFDADVDHVVRQYESLARGRVRHQESHHQRPDASPGEAVGAVRRPRGAG